MRNLEVWLPLRDRVRAEIAAPGVGREAVAAELGLSHHTLKVMLGRRPRVPGRATIERVRAWLAAQAASEPASRLPGGEDPVLAQAEEAGPVQRAHRRLSAAERERLAAWRELENAQALRAGIGVGVEIVDEAIAGKSLEPEIVAKLTQFLSAPLPARC